MVDSIGANLPPSAQAVNKAREQVQQQRADTSASASVEVSLSQEARSLVEIDLLAADTRDLLAANPDESLGRPGDVFDELL